MNFPFNHKKLGICLKYSPICVESTNHYLNTVAKLFKISKSYLPEYVL